MYALGVIVGLLALCEPPPTVRPDERVVFADLTPASQAFIRRHAETTFRMPDGSVWDGYYYFELRKLLGAHLSLQPIKRSVPAGPIMRQSKTVGHEWRLTDAEVVGAWGLKAPSMHTRVIHPRISGGYSLSSDAARTDTWPVLWHSLDVGRPPMLFDDGLFIGTNGTDRGEQIRVVREYEDDTVEIEGWTPVYTSTLGEANVTFRGRAMLDKGVRHRDGRFSGKLLVHYPPREVETNAQLFVTTMENHRVDPEQLLELVQDGRLTLYEFDYTRTSDGRYMWRREPFQLQVRQQSPAAPIAPTEKESAAPKEALPAPGMDRVLLRDGRLFVGKVIAQDDKAVKIKTLIGTMEAELSFARADVQNVHIEPEGGQGPKSDE